eukprot:COSAG03_NODE_1837_length_3455_cov_3.077473_4_plen_161_part_00
MSCERGTPETYSKQPTLQPSVQSYGVSPVARAAKWPDSLEVQPQFIATAVAQRAGKGRLAQDDRVDVGLNICYLHKPPPPPITTTSASSLLVSCTLGASSPPGWRTFADIARSGCVTVRRKTGRRGRGGTIRLRALTASSLPPPIATGMSLSFSAVASTL